ncbi:MAG: AAC(3) family N-acetyltransferase [Anaerolineales bacterium]
MNGGELKAVFESLKLMDKPIIAHASLRPFGPIDGGPEAVLRAMLPAFKGIVMPTFTYKTMITPEVGPADNGIQYGTEKDLNKMAQSFTPSMPADVMMGALPEILRNHPDSKRTDHPILSFAGINADAYLNTQTLDDPLAPIGALADSDGWVVLINVGHDVNTSIHYAEKLAGRKQFLRWALLPDRIVECPGFPGNSSGFSAIDEFIQSDTIRVEMKDGAFVQAISLKRLLVVVKDMIQNDPLALLCHRMDCERCNAVRKQ